MKRRYAIIAFGILLLAGLWRINALKAECETLTATLRTRTLERDTALAAVKGWQERASAADTAILGLQDEMQTCLERERAAITLADEWRSILAEAKSRDMTPEETGKVPDAAARRALLDALDRPL